MPNQLAFLLFMNACKLWICDELFAKRTPHFLMVRIIVPTFPSSLHWDGFEYDYKLPKIHPPSCLFQVFKSVILSVLVCSMFIVCVVNMCVWCLAFELNRVNTINSNVPNSNNNNRMNQKDRKNEWMNERNII